MTGFSHFSWQKTGCIVPTDLGSSCSIRCSTVILILNQEVCWNQSTLKVISNWHSKDGKNILLGWFYPDDVSDTNQERTKIKGSTSSVRWYVFFISTNNCFTSRYKHFCWHLGHQETVAGTLESFSIFIWTEELNTAILCTIGFQSFKCLLSIVKTWR